MSPLDILIVLKERVREQQESPKDVLTLTIADLSSLHGSVLILNENSSRLACLCLLLVSKHLTLLAVLKLN